MPAGLFSKLLGTITSFFQVGTTGPGLNANGAALEVKNAANSAFAILRAATPPVGDNDVTAKSYVDQLANKPLPVGLQFNGNNALPANSGTEQYYVTSTGGANAALGTLLWDDGSGAGTVQVIPAKVGNTIVTTAALAGGTDTFAQYQIYVWTGATWQAVAPAASTTGVNFTIRIPIGTATPVTSATSLPAGAIISDAKLDIVTAYSAGTTIEMGQTGTLAEFMGTPDNTPQNVGVYQVMQDTAAAAATPLVVTIAGAPAAGGGYAVLTYSVPQT